MAIKEDAPQSSGFERQAIRRFLVAFNELLDEGDTDAWTFVRRLGIAFDDGVMAFGDGSYVDDEEDEVEDE